jgi:murein DD-endopeptidase MepM/ murein hydrolase activator NlpD
VYAASDGEVVTVVDGVAERARIHVVSELWHALRQLLGIALTRRIDPAALAGNHVVIDAGGTYALYAHLTPGSVVVEPRQSVGAGDLIGRVGHTGNSTSPHLHFQLMDSSDAMRATGVPCAFAEYLAWRHGRWQHVQGGVPERFERIRSPG